jgi:hypothetical protein
LCQPLLFFPGSKQLVEFEVFQISFSVKEPWLWKKA